MAAFGEMPWFVKNPLCEIVGGSNWQDALYQCALLHEKEDTTKSLVLAFQEFSLLGDWEDAKARRETCAGKLQDLYLAAQAQVKGGRNARAVILGERQLAVIGKLIPAEELDALAKERKKKMALRQRRRNHIGRAAGILFGVCLLGFACLGLPRLHRMRQSDYYRQMQSALDTGDDALALSAARYLMTGSYAREAQRRLPALKRGAADQLVAQMSAADMDLAQEDYSRAMALFQEMNDSAGMQRANRTWGDLLMQAQRYREAEEYYLEGEDQEGADNAAISYGRELIAAQDFKEAARVADRVQDDKRKQAFAGELYDARLSWAKQELLSLEGEEKTEGARSIGEMLTDIDSQLSFCSLLVSSGYDLRDVYPGGVLVKDVSLVDFQPTAENGGLDLEKTGKILPFARRQRSGSKERYYSTSTERIREMVENDRALDESYNIYLLADLLYDLPEQMRGDSYEHCDHVLLADTIYLQEGTAGVKNEGKKVTINGTSSYLPPITAYYPLMTAVDNVTLYDKKAPDHFYLFSYQKNQSIYRRVYPGGFITLSGDVLTQFDGFWGPSDAAFLDQALQEGVNKILEAHS